MRPCLVVTTLLGSSALFAAGCGPDECGELELELSEGPESYPTTGSLSCGGASGGFWDKPNNVAQLGFVSVDIPSDVLIVVNLPISMLVAGSTLSAPGVLTGEAFTGLADTHRNVASLTSGTVRVVADNGVSEDGAFPRRDLRLNWTLEWSSPSASYRSTGEDVLQFTAFDGL